MTRRTTTIDSAWFHALYATDPDPWRFATSDYESEKYAATLAALPDRTFAAGLEVGCSIGILTQALATRCAQLLAIDVAESALAQARARCPTVRFERRSVPEEFPAERFDLIVFSEVLYYLAPPDLAETARRAITVLREGGSLLLVHYLGDTDYPLTGDAAAETFIAAASLTPALQVRETAYRIDRLDHPGPPE